MEITCKNETPTIRSVKHVERGNFSMILYRITKILLGGEGGKQYRFSTTHPNRF